MPLFSNNDITDFANAWNIRRNEAFKQKIEDDFVENFLINLPSAEELRARMLEAIQRAESPRDLYCGTGQHWPDNHTFTAGGWGQRKMSIKQVIYRTNALRRIGEAIGPNFFITKRFVDGHVFFMINFSLPRPQPPPGGEDVYWDMPHLETPYVNNPEDEYSE